MLKTLKKKKTSLRNRRRKITKSSRKHKNRKQRGGLIIDWSEHKNSHTLDVYPLINPPSSIDHDNRFLVLPYEDFNQLMKTIHNNPKLKELKIVGLIPLGVSKDDYEDEDDDTFINDEFLDILFNFHKDRPIQLDLLDLNMSGYVVHPKIKFKYSFNTDILLEFFNKNPRNRIGTLNLQGWKISCAGLYNLCQLKILGKIKDIKLGLEEVEVRSKGVENVDIYQLTSYSDKVKLHGEEVYSRWNSIMTKLSNKFDFIYLGYIQNLLEKKMIALIQKKNLYMIAALRRKERESGKKENKVVFNQMEGVFSQLFPLIEHDELKKEKDIDPETILSYCGIDGLLYEIIYNFLLKYRIKLAKYYNLEDEYLGHSEPRLFLGINMLLILLRKDEPSFSYDFLKMIEPYLQSVYKRGGSSSEFYDLESLLSRINYLDDLTNGPISIEAYEKADEILKDFLILSNNETLKFIFGGIDYNKYISQYLSQYNNTF